MFFEDLDRLDNPELFVHLRELNTLLNNDDAINKPIIFIYAVKDDIFVGNDRTKFLILSFLLFQLLIQRILAKFFSRK